MSSSTPDRFQAIRTLIASAKQSLAPVDYDAFRAAWVGILRTERDSLSAIIAELVDGDSHATTQAHQSERPTAPKRKGGFRVKESVPARVLRFVSENPGAMASDVLAAMRAAVPNVDERLVFSALYRASKEGGPLRTEGTRGKFRYFPRLEETEEP